MAVGEPNPAGCKCVESGSGDFGFLVVAPEVSVSQVIGVEEEDIRALGIGRKRLTSAEGSGEHSGYEASEHDAIVLIRTPWEESVLVIWTFSIVRHEVLDCSKRHGPGARSGRSALALGRDDNGFTACHGGLHK